MTKTLKTPNDLLGQEGVTLGPTPWFEVKQEQVNIFADATEDKQWIHTDPERAAQSPFKGTVAHGFLTLSLTSKFIPELLTIETLSMGVNYGLNKVRFPNAVKVGAKIRARGEFIAFKIIRGAVQSILRVTIEIEGEEKPACIADTISLYYP